MNLLLDTHVFLWFISGDSKLKTRARQEIENPNNLKLVSVASLWEIGIKMSLGKIALERPFKDFIPEQMEINGFELLHLQVGHIAKVISLPFHHRDPFDRMLIGQCMADKLSIVSSDPAFDNYSIKRIW